MKKKELLNKLSDNRITDEVCKSLIVRIADTLLAFPDDVEIDNSIVSLNNLGGIIPTNIDHQSGEQRTVEIIRTELDDLLIELQSWVNRQVKSGDVYAAEVALLNTKREKKIKFRFAVWGFFIALAISAVVFTILRLKAGEESYKWVPEIIGCVDLVIGIGFAIYEQADDYTNKKYHNIAQKKIEDFAIGNNGHNKKVEIKKMVGDYVEGDKTVNN